jgi:hypothetical protein
MLAWLKEHFEMLSVGVVGVFGFGRIVFTQNQHGEKIDKLEKKEEQVATKLTEIHGDIQTLLERTKHL